MSKAKKAVGEKAVEWVQDGMLVGLGTGSTSEYFIKALAKRIEAENLRITAVSSSYSSSILANQLHIPLIGFEQVSSLDLYVDGADEVDPQLNLIKGRGGAMLREKLLARSSKLFLVIVDASKVVSKLGTQFPIPVEILPQSLSFVSKQLKFTQGTPVLRMAEKKDGPVVTDQGNFILDTTYSVDTDWNTLNQTLNNIPGVMDHGLFLNQDHHILVGEETGVREIHS
jgi:ribose 5-phosphate isomerase A